MRPAALLVGLTLIGVPSVQAQGNLVDWLRISVTTKLNNDGRAEVSEIHELAIQGDVGAISRGINKGADQRVEVHGVYQLEADGTRKSLKNAPVANTDSYQVWDWGLQFSLKGENDPPLTKTTRRYLIEYTLKSAITPAWDLAAGAQPLDAGTRPQDPRIRASEVFAAWKQAWPEIDRHYRFDHDVEFPTRGTPHGLPEINYRLEYDTAWVLLDPERDIGVAIPDVDYRVQRTLKYLPPGRPKEAGLQNAAFRMGGLVGPLALGLVMSLIFLAANRLLSRAPKGDSALFERRIAALPPEVIAAQLGERIQVPSFETLMLRMASQKKLSITIEKPETEEAEALASLRLTVDRSKLPEHERIAVDELFGSSNTVSTQDIQKRFRGREFDPDAIVERAFEPLIPKRVTRRRALWAALHVGMMVAGIVLLVKCLVDRTMADPAPLFAGIVGGNILVTFWPKGSSARPASAITILVVILALGLLGAVLALTPNTPLSGLAALGFALMSAGHCAGYLAGLPKSSQADLELAAARDWAIGELKRSRPALRDAWVELLEAVGAGGALAKWKKRSSDFTAAPDLADMGQGDIPSGPPFTGESPQPPALPPEWVDGFSVYGGDDEDGEA